MLRRSSFQLADDVAPQQGVRPDAVHEEGGCALADVDVADVARAGRDGGARGVEPVELHG